MPFNLISDFKNSVISVIPNKISGEAHKIWQQLVTPGLKSFQIYAILKETMASYLRYSF